jgi:hypothetical protein
VSTPYFSLVVARHQLTNAVRRQAVSHRVNRVNRATRNLTVTLKVVEHLEHEVEVESRALLVSDARAITELGTNAESIRLVLVNARGVFDIRNLRQRRIRLGALVLVDALTVEHAVQPLTLGLSALQAVLLGERKLTEFLEVLRRVGRIKRLEILVVVAERLTAGLQPVSQQLAIVFRSLVIAPRLVILDRISADKDRTEGRVINRLLTARQGREATGAV